MCPTYINNSILVIIFFVLFKGTVAPDLNGLKVVWLALVGQAFMGIKTADGKQNFKLASIWFYSKLSPPSGLKFFSRRIKLGFFAV